jgi:hypothetical protein
MEGSQKRIVLSCEYSSKYSVSMRLPENDVMKIFIHTQKVWYSTIFFWQFRLKIILRLQINISYLELFKCLIHFESVEYVGSTAIGCRVIAHHLYRKVCVLLSLSLVFGDRKDSTCICMMNGHGGKQVERHDKKSLR